MTDSPRSLTIPEVQLIGKLIEGKDNLRAYLQDMTMYSVTEADDGGMGSLIFHFNNKKVPGKRVEVASAEFFDDDGVKVSAALFLGDLGRFAELDLWKVDFSKLNRIPEPQDIVVIN